MVISPSWRRRRRDGQCPEWLNAAGKKSLKVLHWKTGSTSLSRWRLSGDLWNALNCQSSNSHGMRALANASPGKLPRHLNFMYLYDIILLHIILSHVYLTVDSCTCSQSRSLGIAVWRQRMVMLERSGQSWAVAGAFPAPIRWLGITSRR